jgi:hypothetical protein
MGNLVRKLWGEFPNAGFLNSPLDTYSASWGLNAPLLKSLEMASSRGPGETAWSDQRDVGK